jgi:hypothetical protein
MFISIMTYVNKKTKTMKVKQTGSKLSLTINDVRSVKTSIDLLRSILDDYNTGQQTI